MTRHHSHSLAYRPEVDGLRALAVVAVMFFHAPLGWSGGYVGVDVFFVISGYLITSLILRDLRAGRFSLAEFWERRVRRILPALSVMVLGSMLVGGFLFLPNDYEALGRSAIAQALLVANIYFWRDDFARGGYFGPASEERPLLHTWSLAVEEQFYLLFPLLLVCLFLFKRLRSPGAASWLLFCAVIAGLAAAHYGVQRDSGAAFYLLHTRAWELLCGALIAVLPAGCVPRRVWLRELASWLGLTGIVLACWFYTKTTPFPGLAALPPSLGAALFIWGNTRSAEGAGTLTSAGRLLALRPVVFVGLISYSLYLWHWPVLVFGKYWWPYAWSPWYFRAGLLLVAGALAVLSWRWVETPFREKRIGVTRRGIFGFAGAATLATLLLGTGLVVSRGLPARLPDIVARNAEAEQDKLISDDVDASVENIRQDRLFPLGITGRHQPAGLLLWGDSHARHAIPAVDALCHELGIAGRAVIQSSTPPLLDAAFDTKHGMGEKTVEFSAAVLEYVERNHIPHALLAARWSWYQEHDPALLEKSLTGTIHALRESGCHVWILQDTPDVDIQPTRALIRSALWRRGNGSWHGTASEHGRKNAVLHRLSGQSLPAVFIDPAPLLLDPRHDRYRPDIDGVSIYYDDDHLTIRAARALLLPLLRENMAPHLPSGGAAPPERPPANRPDH